MKCEDTKRLKVKKWKNDYSTNQKKASVVILTSKLISEPSTPRTKGVISWRWSIFWEDIIINVYASKTYEAKLTELQRETDKFIIIVEE